MPGYKSKFSPYKEKDVLSQTPADHAQHVQDVDEAIFLALQIAGGQILLPILLFTVLFSSKVKRHPIFASFCISWICSSIAFSLLLYKERSSNHDMSLDPAYDECLFQATLINGVQAWTVCTTFVIVLHFWKTLRAIIGDDTTNTKSRGRTWVYNCLMIGGPFLFFLIFTISSIITGKQLAIDQISGQPIPDSNSSVAGAFYCVIILSPDYSTSISGGMKLFDAVFYFQALITVITTYIEVDIVRLLIMHRKSPKINKSSQLKIFLRVSLFSVYRNIVMIMLLVAQVAHPDEILLIGVQKDALFNGIANFLQAAIPLAAFLIFATEKDILDSWCFWRHLGRKAKSHIQIQDCKGQEGTDLQSV